MTQVLGPLISDRARVLLEQRRALAAEGRWSDALTVALMAYALDHTSPVVWHAMGNAALSAEFRAGERSLLPFAVAQLARAAEAMPESVTVPSELLVPLLMCGDDEEVERWALHAMRAAALSGDPLPYNVLASLATALNRLGRDSDAARFEDMLLLAWREERRVNPATRHNIDGFVSELLVRRGDYDAGWREFGSFFRRFAQEPPMDLPSEWDGQSHGPVLIVTEAGRGDVLLSCRYFPAIAARSGAPVVVMSHRPELAAFLREVPGVSVAGDWDECLAEKPRWHIGSLQALSIFRPSPETMPAPPALSPSLAWSPSWRTPGHVGPLRVGICWKGQETEIHSVDRNVSDPDAALAPLFAVDGVEWVSLQQDTDPPAGAPFARRVFARYLETAQIIRSLDLVVTVDTSVAHLAGTLGAPTLVLAPSVPDWRWTMTKGDRSLWYPSVCVLRKRHRHDWPAVIEDAARKLRGYGGR